MKHTGTIKLTTDRLVLRPVESTDAQKMFVNWTNNDNVARYTTWYAHESITVTEQYLDYVLSKYPNENHYRWGIEYENELIGEISVVSGNDQLGICEMGYVLSEDYWGKGFMAESFQTVLKFLFNNVGYGKVVAGCDNLNIGSSKVMEKAGMKLEGVLRESILRKDGSYGDTLYYDILKDEFF